STNMYYRAAVSCGSDTAYSDSVFLSISPAFPSGVYTINSAQPTGGTNFHSFTEAIAAMSCGVTGAVTFNVEPGSVPYNEQISIPEIAGLDSANRLTINGNGATLFYGSNYTYNRATLTLNGTDYCTIDSLH